MKQKSIALVALLLLMTNSMVPELAAHPLDTYGAGSRSSAMGGGVTGSTSGMEAAYHNPAAATLTPSFQAGAGLLFADDFITLNDRDADVGSNTQFTVGLAAPIPLGEALGDRLYLSALITLPYESIYEVRQPDDEAPNIVFWDSRNRRLSLTATLACRIADWLSVGLGASLLPDVDGVVAVDLIGREGENSTRITVDYNLAPVAGLFLEPLPELSIGLTYRGAQTTEILIPVHVDVLPGVPPIIATVAAPAYSVPHQVAAGFGLDITEALHLAADLTWSGYGDFSYSSPDVTIYNLNGNIVQESPRSEATFSDTLAVRTGMEWRAKAGLMFRGGYGYVPTPVSAQTDRTNLMDTDRHEISMGAGIELPESWLWAGVSAIELGVHGRAAIFERREFEKETFLPDNPGFPSISVSGGSFNMSADVRFWF